MENINKALEYFSNGHSCSQAIFCTFTPKLGLDYNLAYKISAAFGGGMARTGHTCGAVSGALMVIGLKYRSSNPSDTENRDHTYEIAREYLKEFKEIHGSQTCKDLIGFDLSTEKGLEEAQKANIFENKCQHFVKTSAKLLIKLMEKL